MGKENNKDLGATIGIGFFVVGVSSWAFNKFFNFPFMTTFIIIGIIALILWKLNYVIGYTKITIEFIKNIKEK